MTDWENFSKHFLAEYLETLLKSLEKHLDKETRQKVLNETGKYCARAHATEMFKQLKAETKDFNEFIVELNNLIRHGELGLQNFQDNRVRIIRSRAAIDDGIATLINFFVDAVTWHIKHSLLLLVVILDTPISTPVKSNNLLSSL